MDTINIQLSDLAKEHVYGDDWTETSQDKLEMWRSNAIDLAELHERARKRWTQYRDSLKLPSLALTAAASFVMGINQFYGEQYFDVLALVLTAADVFLKGVYYKDSPSERATRHNSASNAYGSLSRTIEYQLYLPPHKRPDVEVAFVTATREMNAIGSRAPAL